MSLVKTVGIPTGGGDCPGLNAVIRAVVKSAILQHGWRVIGIEDSFDGLIWPNKHRELTLNDVSGLLSRGGTILGTTNRGNPLGYRVQEGGKEAVRDARPSVVRRTHDRGQLSKDQATALQPGAHEIMNSSPASLFLLD